MQWCRLYRMCWAISVVLLCVAWTTIAIAAQPSTTSQPTMTATAMPTTMATTAPATQPEAVVTPFPITEVGDQLESATASIRDIDARALNNQVEQAIRDELANLSAEINGHLDENERLLSPAPSLDTLRSVEQEWISYRKQLGDWSGEVANRQIQLARDNATLEADGIIWSSKYKDAQQAMARGALDNEVVNRIKTQVDNIAKGVQHIYDAQVQLSQLQGNISAPLTHVDDALSAVRQARERALNRLLVQDSPPLWAAIFHGEGDQNYTERSRNAFSAQWTQLRSYVDRVRPNMLLNIAGIMMLSAGFIWMRRQSRSWAANDSNLEKAAKVFNTPIATAVVLSMSGGTWIYPQAPRLFWAILGTLLLFPLVFLLRRLIEAALRPVLYALMGFSFLGLLLSITAALPLISRLVFLVEMGGGALFFVWFLRSIAKPSEDTEPKGPMWRVAIAASRLSLVIASVAFVANLLGYVSLSRLLGGSMVTAAYLGLLLDASVRVVDALLLGAFNLYPLTELGMVRRHRDLLLKRLHILVALAAIAVWAYIFLESLAIRGPILMQLHAIMRHEFSYGAVTLSLHQVYVFVLTVVAAFAISRLANFILDEDIYPRIQLARGVPYAISTLLRYSILLLGFIAAITSLGYRADQLTILVSAFGVGLGFGMQNIVNNFVSGLILLFERPVQVGDVIQVDDLTGVVSRIGIRASIIRTNVAAEIIIPNGNLISNRVINWTLSNRQRGIELPLTIASGPDPKHVIELLLAVAKAHPLVAASPTPQAYFIDFAAGGMKFELRVWTNRYEDWTRMRSDLSIAISAMIVKEKLELK